MKQIDDLVERLQQATGPDRSIDRAIHKAVSARIVRDETFVFGPKDGEREIEVVYRLKLFCWLPPRYTKNLNTAASVVPRGWWWTAGDCELTAHASVGPEKTCGLNFDSFDVDLRQPCNPAIALCAASLMARSALLDNGYG